MGAPRGAYARDADALQRGASEASEAGVSGRSRGVVGRNGALSGELAFVASLLGAPVRTVDR